MRVAPTIQEVQLVINGTHKIYVKPEQQPEASQISFASSRVPKPNTNDGEAGTAHVSKTVILFSQNGGYEAFAVVNTFGAETYQVKGWAVTTVSRGGYLRGDVGDVITLGEETLFFANVDGGNVLPEQECLAALDESRQRIEKEQLQELQDQEQRRQGVRVQALKQDVLGKLSQRGRWLQQDKSNLAQFPELREFRSALEDELRSQQQFFAQLEILGVTLQHIGELQAELEEANKRATANLSPMRDRAKLLIQEQAAHEKLRREREEKLEAHREWKENSDRTVAEYNRRERIRQNSQPSVTTSGGGCILVILSLFLGSALLSGISLSPMRYLLLLLNR